MSYAPPPPGGNDQPPGGGYGGGEQPPGGGYGGGEQPPGGGYGNGGYGSNYPPPPPGGGYGGYGGQPAGDSQKALWSMITGIIGVTVGLCFCGPFNILPIVLGILARRDIAATGGAQGGSGKATAGIVLGTIGLVGWLAILIWAAATGNFNVNTYSNL
ncbi:DUF4190 domain-containing protein [Solicola sp. PLA-1-18]|uniref:DUF4190 domain-containing protein n=1 Tax=Solicola sp. PLA-1-18 TaxID=3380532 RepID=UPI003B822907